MTQIKPLQVKNHLAGHQNKKPQFAKNIKLQNGETVSVADPVATRALVALMDMNAVLGGAASHYGGPAALAELMSALHGIIFYESEKKNKNWFDLYHIINDAGHCENGLYALKANYGMAGLDIGSLKKFRSMESGLTGHGEVHCFPEGVYLSNGPLGSAFPQSQGLAMAEKLSGTNRTTFCVLSDGAAMEGEAKEALAAIPGLAQKNKLAPYVVIISDNNTKLTGRIDADSFSMNPTFKSLETLGWHVLFLENGNDLQKCADTIEKAKLLAEKNPAVPVAIWAKTIKGIGTKKTADSASGGHGFPCKSPTELADFITEIYADEKSPELFKSWINELIELEKKIKAEVAVADTGEKIQTGISKAMIAAFKKGYPVLSVTSDLPGSTGVAGFRKEFPDACLDVGVAESNMISVSAGLSKQGYIPVVDTFAQFGVTKGALPLTMASLSEAPVIGIFSHTGFQDAADGASHQALSYMAMLATIPGLDLYSLSSSEEAEHLLTEVIEKFVQTRANNKTPPTSIFFLGRENFPKTFKTEENKITYQLSKPQVLKNNLGTGKNVLLVTTGSLVGQALLASDILKSKSVGTAVVNINCLNKMNPEDYKTLVSQSQGNIVTVEDHQVALGLGSFFTHQLVQAGLPVKIKSLGVHAEFGQSAYNAIELYRKHKIDSAAIVDAALKI